MKEYQKIIILAIIFLFILINLNIKIYSEINSFELNLNSNEFYKILNIEIYKHQINFYVSKIKIAILIYNIKSDNKYIDYKIYSDELNNKINEIINNKDFNKFISDYKINELYDKIKDKDLSINEKSIIANRIIEIYYQMFEDFKSYFIDIFEIISNKVSFYIQFSENVFKILEKFIEFNNIDILINIVGLNSKFILGFYNNIDDYIEISLTPYLEEFIVSICHELVHRYQNKSNISFDILYKIYSDQQTKENLEKIVFELNKKLDKNDLFEINEIFDYFWNYPYNIKNKKNWLNEIGKGNIKILWGLNEAMAYGINPIIYKILCQKNEMHLFIIPSNIIPEYWINFFNWLNYDYFFIQIDSMQKTEFWYIYLKKYIEYCLNIEI